MPKFQALLNLRLKQKERQKHKMTALAEKTSRGELSSFSGIFHLSPLSDQEKEEIKNILLNFREETKEDISEDLQSLSNITSEIKAITNQAVILHGERIKNAQTILKEYKEGAFTAWLMTTYGNRQTPYNFLYYFELSTTLPEHLRPTLDAMPRQAVYALASRSGKTEKKQELVKNYNGQSKQELLSIIRKLFPLDGNDKRLPNVASQALSSLAKLKTLFKHPLFSPSEKQKKEIKTMLSNLENHLHGRQAIS